MTHSKQLPVAGIAQRRRVLMKLLGDAAEPPSDASGYTQAMQRWLMIRPCRISVRLVLSRGKYRKQQAKEPAKWMHVAQTLELCTSTRLLSEFAIVHKVVTHSWTTIVVLFKRWIGCLSLQQEKKEKKRKMPQFTLQLTCSQRCPVFTELAIVLTNSTCCMLFCLCCFIWLYWYIVLHAATALLLAWVDMGTGTN